MVCIYSLTDPRPGYRESYVGQSIDVHTRYLNHLTEANKLFYVHSAKVEWIRDLLNIGLKPILNELCWVSEFEANQVEADILAVYRALRGNACLNSAGYRPYPLLRRRLI